MSFLPDRLSSWEEALLRYRLKLYLLFHPEARTQEEILLTMMRAKWREGEREGRLLIQRVPDIWKQGPLSILLLVAGILVSVWGSQLGTNRPGGFLAFGLGLALCLLGVAFWPWQDGDVPD
jgi:hypothetical protein